MILFASQNLESVEEKNKMKFEAVTVLHVYLDLLGDVVLVGRLAVNNQQVWFEYDKEFISRELEISPFKLPLKSGVQKSRDQVFNGLFGVFNDSLPDAWGKLLLDRELRSRGIQIESLTALDRLTYVGNKGMGALVYEPDYAIYKCSGTKINIETLAKESLLTLEGETDTAIFELLSLNGSAGGARPKIAVGLSSDKKKLFHGMDLQADAYEHWLIKFPALSDHKDIGAVEYAYSLMARAAGIEMMPTYLFKKKYFGVKRFDRDGCRRVHVHTASGLLHADHHYPSLDYENLLKLCLALTKDMRELEKLYRLAVFNVLAHNRDDHSKNFSFMMNERGKWSFAPAYDLTYSYGPGGEHSMLVMGEGKNPTKEHLMKLAAKFGLRKANEIYDEVREAVSRWDCFADEAGVSRKTRQLAHVFTNQELT